MSRSVLVLLLIAFLPLLVSGQSEKCSVRLYNSWYFMKSDHFSPVCTYTYEFRDSSVTVVARDKYICGTIPGAEAIQLIPVTDIDKMMFRRKGRMAAAAVIGGIAGALTGIIIGTSLGSTPENDIGLGVSTGFKVFSLGLLGSGTGILAGMIIGVQKKVVIINGDIKTYEQSKPGVVAFSIKYYLP